MRHLPMEPPVRFIRKPRKVVAKEPSQESACQDLTKELLRYTSRDAATFNY